MNGPVVVMGVAGSGKSTIAARLADRLGVPFAEGDEFHPRANIEKMAAGTALTDDDRWPWLDAVGAWLAGHGDGGVVTCSALKRAYRDRLRGHAPGTRFVHLAVDERLVRQRFASRSGHFMPESLIDSQLATLEPLGADEAGVTVDAGLAVDAVVDAAAGAVVSR